MTFNKKESKILFKAKNALEEMFDGNLKKYHVTPYTAHEIARCYNEIVRSRKTSTISQDVKDFFKKRKFNISVEGIGWKISL